MVVISDIRSMFWGVTIDAGKRYSQTVTNSFHLSMAALEPGSGSEYVQVMIQHSSSEFLLCSLKQGMLLQQPLDLIFAEGEEVSFSLVGKGIVHLTGYLLPDQPEDNFSDEESDEDSDAPQLVEMDVNQLKAGQKRKAIEDGSAAKKKKLFESITEDDDDYNSEEDEDYEANEDDDSDIDDSSDDNEDEDSEDDDDDSDDDDEFSEDDLTFDEDEDDEEESEEEEETPAKQKTEMKTPKSDKKRKASETPKSDKKKLGLETPKSDKKKLGLETPKSDKKKDLETPKSDKKKLELETPKSDKKKKVKEGNTPKTPISDVQMPKTPIETPGTPVNGESGKKKKKKRKSKGDTPGLADSSTAESPAKSASKGKDKTPNTSKGNTPRESKDNTPSKQETPGKRKVVSGGTVVEDLKIGHGPEAKQGKMVSVYYVGTLTKNNKRFDSCTDGKPFRFRLKQGEVIKGWDNGVEGMKVGGKRKITVPANQGYGNQRQGPIPPNSSLTFEVELKAVS